MAVVALLLGLVLSVSGATAQSEGDADWALVAKYSREMLETLKKQVDWAKMATDQLSTMMGPRIGTHFTELAGYCADGVSVTAHWNVSAGDCLYECLSADECAGYNYYNVRDNKGFSRCEMVTVNLFCGLQITPNCTMFIRRWRNNQFGTLFSGSRIASMITRTETAPSMSECVGMCKRDDRCMHISYRQPDSACTMHATGGGATIEDLSWLAYGRVVRCPDFYIRFQGSCFRPIKTANESWLGAKDACSNEGARMVNIHSPEENQFILDTILREAPNINWWIGAHESSREWRWINTPEAESEVNFQFWSDTTNDQEEAKCAYFDVQKQRWDRSVCNGATDSEKFYYICETTASQLQHPFPAPS